jgi:hypothetical protein
VFVAAGGALGKRTGVAMGVGGFVKLVRAGWPVASLVRGVFVRSESSGDGAERLSAVPSEAGFDAEVREVLPLDCEARAGRL